MSGATNARIFKLIPEQGHCRHLQIFLLNGDRQIILGYLFHSVDDEHSQIKVTGVHIAE